MGCEGFEPLLLDQPILGSEPVVTGEKFLHAERETWKLQFNGSAPPNA